MKGEQILNKDWSPRFAVVLAEKDQRLVQDAAASQGVTMPINSAVRRVFAEAIESGRGDKDMCAVTDLFFERAGLKR
jgi:3-hydroxyisobutyrate dehydrogenase-like beta-hydroxyacid dehydrogenase